MNFKNAWRSSKLIGLNVYNRADEKLGDINEILFDKEGKVMAVVIGVGGFLGMGEHDIAVSMDRLKFLEETHKSKSAKANEKTTTGTTAAGKARCGERLDARSRRHGRDQGPAQGPEAVQVLRLQLKPRTTSLIGPPRAGRFFQLRMMSANYEEEEAQFKTGRSRPAVRHWSGAQPAHESRKVAWWSASPARATPTAFCSTTRSSRSSCTRSYIVAE